MASFQVLEKNTTGWWLVIIAGKQGWAPGSYIQEQKVQHDSVFYSVKFIIVFIEGIYI